MLWEFSQISVLSLDYFGILVAKEIVYMIAVSIRDQFLFLRRNREGTLVCVCVCDTRVPVSQISFSTGV